jgi:adenine phosphoribosyltransferase
MNLEGWIRDVPDFPIHGILFKDITPLLNDPVALREAVDRMAAPFRNQQIDRVVAIESRGFLFGMPIAYQLGAGFVPVRKAGKLPSESVGVEYSLEYGTNRLEMHRDAIQPGERVLIVDDLLATGGSAAAAVNLVEKLGGTVQGLVFLIELEFLQGREALSGYDVVSILVV